MAASAETPLALALTEEFVKEQVAKVALAISPVVNCSDARRGIEMGVHCEVRPFLRSWRRHVGDPDDQFEEWTL